MTDLGLTCSRFRWSQAATVYQICRTKFVALSEIVHTSVIRDLLNDVRVRGTAYPTSRWLFALAKRFDFEWPLLKKFYLYLRYPALGGTCSIASRGGQGGRRPWSQTLISQGEINHLPQQKEHAANISLKSA